MKQPLAEVFGFPVDNFSPEAVRHRENRLCPFNNRVPNCTKDKAKDPLGVCSVFDGDKTAITCPVRFRESWLIADAAAKFFFPPGANWTSLTEVRLPDKNGKSAGNIDVVLVSYDAMGHITDFGAVEVQAVYISGNVRNAFNFYTQDPAKNFSLTWEGDNYPRPDYLSSSRKRLAPQLIYKGGILNQWGKKMAVVVDQSFFQTLPVLPETSQAQSIVAWLVYDLLKSPANNRYALNLIKSVYTDFNTALEKITTADAGPVEVFMELLQEKLDEKFETGYSPDAPILTDPFAPA